MTINPDILKFADLPWSDEEIAAAQAANPSPPLVELPTWPEPRAARQSPLAKDTRDPRSAMNKEAAILHILYDSAEE